MLRPVLIAEDDEADVVLLKKVLSECRLKNPAVFVSDGQGVLDYLKGEAQFTNRAAYPLPSMLLLDMMMRGISGPHVLEWMRKEFKADFPIVILTGHQNLSQMTKAYQLGAHSFLLKPLEKEELFGFLKNFRELEFSKDN